jgi:hypothetical protein
MTTLTRQIRKHTLNHVKNSNSNLTQNEINILINNQIDSLIDTKKSKDFHRIDMNHKLNLSHLTIQTQRSILMELYIKANFPLKVELITK